MRIKSSACSGFHIVVLIWVKEQIVMSSNAGQNKFWQNIVCLCFTDLGFTYWFSVIMLVCIDWQPDFLLSIDWIENIKYWACCINFFSGYSCLQYKSDLFITFPALLYLYMKNNEQQQQGDLDSTTFKVKVFNNRFSGWKSSV